MPLVEQKPDLLAGSGDCSAIKPPYQHYTSPRDVKHYGGHYGKNNSGDATQLDFHKLEYSPRTPAKKRPTPIKLTPRRRSRTLTEFSSDKKKVKCSRVKFQQIAGDEYIHAEYVYKMVRTMKEKESARRVATVLMLNAWRRRRVQHQLQTDSVHCLEEQVNQCQLQINFLRNLREKESEKRLEVALESKKFKTELDDKILQCQKIEEEKQACEMLIRSVEIKTQKLKTDLDEVSQENFRIQSENNFLQNKLDKEKEKCNNYLNDKQFLLDKVASSDSVIYQQQVNLNKLHDIANDLEAKMEEKTKAAQDSSKICVETQEKLKQVEDKNKTLEKELRQHRKNERKMRTELTNSQSKISILEKENLGLKMDCSTLKATMIRTEERLSKISNRGWWETPVNTFAKIATIMLPALPEEMVVRDV